MLEKVVKSISAVALVVGLSIIPSGCGKEMVKCDLPSSSENNHCYSHNNNNYSGVVALSALPISVCENDKCYCTKSEGSSDNECSCECNPCPVGCYYDGNGAECGCWCPD